VATGTADIEVVPLTHKLGGWARSVVTNQQFMLLVALAVLVAYFTARAPVFLSSGELANVLTDFCSIILLAVGETFVIASGGIDLSVGSAASLAGVAGAFAMRGLVNTHQNEALVLFVGTVVCAGCGLVIGLANAALINWARLVPFVATLAMLGGAGGLAIVFTNGEPIGLDIRAISYTVAKVGPFSYPSFVVIALVVVAWLCLHFTRYGRYTFAIGSDAFAARAAGINVRRHVTSVYALSGLLAGLTGMFIYMRLGSGAPTAGLNDELEAIAAVVIGGASLFGGVGRLSGTVLGALIITTVTSGLIISNVQANWDQVAIALLIAVAAAMQALRPARRR
jgi:ribose transport system permease protein